MKLDTISNEDVQRLKLTLKDKAPKTVNNVLTVVNTTLKVAIEWGVIERMPCTVRLLRTTKGNAKFHDFDVFERLVLAAQALDWRAELIVLLGGEAGLRCGEMMALESSDVDYQQGSLSVQRSDWKGQVTAPKGNRVRHVPLTYRRSPRFGDIVICEVRWCFIRTIRNGHR